MLNDLCRSPTIVLLLLLPQSEAALRLRSQFGRITVFQGRISNDQKRLGTFVCIGG